MNNRFFFQFGDKQVEWDDFEFTPLQAGSVVACADNAAFVRQACREGNPCVRRWAASRPELDVDDVRHLVATEDPQIEFNRCRHYVCRNYAFLQRLPLRDLLSLIGEKLVSLEDVLDALSESDLPLGELKQLGRELFEHYDGPLTHGVLNPRIRSVSPVKTKSVLRPLDGFFLSCGSLSIPLSAQEAFWLPDNVLDALGLFEVLSEFDDPEIRRRVAIRRGASPHIWEKLVKDPDLSVRLRAGSARGRRYHCMTWKSSFGDLEFFWPTLQNTPTIQVTRKGKKWSFLRGHNGSDGAGLIDVFQTIDERRNEQTARFLRGVACSEDPFMRGLAASAKLQKDTAAGLARDADPLVRRALLQNIHNFPLLDSSDLVVAVGQDPDLVRTALIMLDVAQRFGLVGEADAERVALQKAAKALSFSMRAFDGRTTKDLSERFREVLKKAQSRPQTNEVIDSGYELEWNGLSLPLSNETLNAIVGYWGKFDRGMSWRFVKFQMCDKEVLHRRIESADFTQRDRMARQAVFLNSVAESDLALLLTNTKLFEEAFGQWSKLRPKVRTAIDRLALQSEDPRRRSFALEQNNGLDVAGVLRYGECRANVSLNECRWLTSSVVEEIPEECTAEDAERIHAFRKALLASPDFVDRVVAAHFPSISVAEAQQLADEQSVSLNCVLLDNRTLLVKMSFEKLLQLAGSSKGLLEILRRGIMGSGRNDEENELVVVNQKLSEPGLAECIDFGLDIAKVAWYEPKPVTTPWDNILHLEYLGIDFPLKLRDFYAWMESLKSIPMSFPKSILDFLRTIPDDDFQRALSERLDKAGIPDKPLINDEDIQGQLTFE